MGYHFLLGAVVGAASVLVLGSRRSKDLFDKGQNLVKENLDEGVKAFNATTDCIREKMKSTEQSPAAATEKTAAAKRPQRTRKTAAKKAPTNE